MNVSADHMLLRRIDFLVRHVCDDRRCELPRFFACRTTRTPRAHHATGREPGYARCDELEMIRVAKQVRLADADRFADHAHQVGVPCGGAAQYILQRRLLRQLEPAAKSSSRRGRKG
jgi:hypothetical protein